MERLLTSIFILSFFIPFNNNLLFSQYENSKKIPMGFLASKNDKELNDTITHKLPTVFVQNQGQLCNDILFYSWFPQGYVIYKNHINIQGVEVYLQKSTVSKKDVLNTSSVIGNNKQIGIFNYFGCKKSISNIPSFGEIIYKNVYPFIDLKIVGMQEGKVEFIWDIYPGGNPDNIELNIKNVKLSSQSNGKILVTPKNKKLNSFIIGNIYAYQNKTEILVKHRIVDESKLQYQCANYDKNQLLVIDPVVAAIITGSSTERIYSIAVDGSGGNVFVAGYTSNYSDFAPSNTGYGTAGGDDAFVTKLNNALNSHIATAIIYSSANDNAESITIDGTGGDILITGITSNYSDFAPSNTVFGTTGGDEAFVTKLNNALSSHLASAIIASSAADNGYDIAIDGTGGNVYISGRTSNQANFSSSRSTFGTTGGVDAFITKLNNGLTTHSATAIVTSSSNDDARAIAIDGSGGSVYIGGSTANQADFAPSRSTFGTTGSSDVFVTKMNNALSSHTATAIIASSSNDELEDLLIDGTGGNVFINGQTYGQSDFSSSRTVIGTTGDQDCFVTKLNNALSSHSATAIVASSAPDRCYGIAINSTGGDVFISGTTGNLADFSTTPQNTYGSTGGNEAFVVRLNNGLSTHIITAIVTSSGGDIAFCMIMEVSGGTIFIAGMTTNQSDFASSRSVFGTTGGADTFVASLSQNSVLPIELLSFSANCIQINSYGNNQVEINWSTSSETNNNYFTLERTNDGVNNKKEFIIDGAGNSTQIINYSFIDSEPLSGTSYYRLKQTDFDGKYKFYDFVTITCDNIEEFDFNIYPNPIEGDNINILLNGKNNMETLIVVYDIIGNEIYSKVLLTKIDGPSIYALAIQHNLYPGIYFVAATNNNKILKKKIIIQ